MESLVKKVIMIVEDDLDLLRMYKRALLRKNETYIVLGYSYPAEALEYFKDSSCKYDLVITDIDLPQMKGYEFIEKIREIDPSIKSIGMSGTCTEEWHIDQFDRFLAKPFNTAEFQQIVVELLG